MDEILSGKVPKQEIVKENNFTAKSVQVKEREISPAAEIIKAEDSKVPHEKKEKIRSSSRGKIDYSSWDNLETDEEDCANQLYRKPIESNEKQNISPRADEKKEAKENKIYKLYKDKLDQMKQAAKDCFNQKDYPKSLDLYNNVIEFSKSPPKEWVQSSKEDPFAFLDKFLIPTNIPIDAATFVNRATVLFHMEKYNQSNKDCIEALKLNNDNIKAHYRQSQNYKFLTNYHASKLSLMKCIELLNSNSENHQLVSEKIILSELETVKKLESDCEIANMEKDHLLKDSASVMLEQLMASFAELNADVFSSTGHSANGEQEKMNKLSNGITAILNTHKSMQHAFRLLGGYEKLMNVRLNHQCKNIIIASIHQNEENQRYLGRFVEKLLEKLLFLKDEIEKHQIFVDLIDEFLNSPFLTQQLIKPRRLNPELGQIMINATSDEKYLTIFTLLVEFDSKTLHNFNIKSDEIIPIILSKLNKCCNELNLKMVEFLLKLTTIDENFCKNTVYTQNDLLIQSSIFLENSLKGDSRGALNILGFLHNLILLSKKNFKVIESSSLIQCLIEAMCNNELYAHCLKVLSRLVTNHSKLLSQYINLLNWNDCIKILKGEITIEKRDLISNWIQLLVVYLGNNSNSMLFYQLHGEKTLIQLLEKCMNETKGLEILIGNLSLALSKLADDGIE
jgi:hypothetical protein